MKKVILCMIATGYLCLQGCGGEYSSELDAAPGFEAHYIPFPESSVRQATIAKARAETIRVCLEGSVSKPDFERVKVWTRRAVLTWLRIAAVMDTEVSTRMAFDCTARHLTIRLRSGNGTSFASPSVTTIYLDRPYGTWTHELGHALAGLGDTYASGAGRCKSNQPQSLMCWGAYGPRAAADQWSTLWPDDIAGFRSNYTKLFGRDLEAPEWSAQINLEAPLDLNQPWPGFETTLALAHENEDFAVNVFDGPATKINHSYQARRRDL